MTTENLAVEPAIADVAPAVEPDADSAPAAPDTSAKPERDKVQERIDKLTREKYEERRARESLERELAQLRARETTPQEPVAPAKAPTLAEFEYDEAKYQDAVLKFTESTARKAAVEALKAEKEQDAARAKAQSFVDRETKFAEKMADYREVVYSDDVAISQAMAEVIRESEMGPELAYHLAKNRDIAEALYALPPMAAARELGKIEARLSVAPAPPPPVTSAPPPPPKLAAAEAVVSFKASDPESDKLSDAEWKRQRERELKRRK